MQYIKFFLIKFKRMSTLINEKQFFFFFKEHSIKLSYLFEFN